jgi:Kef-type K+ transport system membrane component KefB
MSYFRFGAMIAVSTIVMFGLMYLNTFTLDHVRYSQTRTWMALVMGASMAIIMLGFMFAMYKNAKANIAIMTAATLIFAGALWLIRSQQTVDDIAYMKAMILHHSIAVLTSERARIRDPRVRKLADEIIKDQTREIAEMKSLIADLDRNPPPSRAAPLPPQTTGSGR